MAVVAVVGASVVVGTSVVVGASVVVAAAAAAPVGAAVVAVTAPVAADAEDPKLMLKSVVSMEEEEEAGTLQWQFWPSRTSCTSVYPAG